MSKIMKKSVLEKSGYYMIDERERKRLLFLVRAYKRDKKKSEQDKISIELAIKSLIR